MPVETAEQQATAELMGQHPEVIDRLAAVKDANGNRVFNDIDIAGTFLNCGETIKSNPEALHESSLTPDYTYFEIEGIDPSGLRIGYKR